MRRTLAAALLALTVSVGVGADVAGAQTSTTEADEGIVEEGREQVEETVNGGDDDSDKTGLWGLLGLLGLLGLAGLAGRKRGDRDANGTARTVGSERIR